MSDLFVFAMILDDPSNKVLLSYSSAPDNLLKESQFNMFQASKASPAPAVVDRKLWTAFRGNESTTIYVAGLSNWQDKKSVGQSTHLAPALASFKGKLWVAYIGETSSHVELVSSTDGTHWSAGTTTGQSSKMGPSLSEFGDKLWVAYIGETSGHVELVSSTDGTHWSAGTTTGQSSKMGPSLTVFGDKLWLAYIGETSGHVELVSSTDGTHWSAGATTGQSSKMGPSLTVFGGKLWVAYIGETSGYVELVSSTDGIHWSPGTVISDSSKLAPALAAIAAETPPNGLGGFNQYVLSSPVERGKPYVPLIDIVVEIAITDDIVVSPTSGLSDTITIPQPIGFQINGFSQKGDKTICWQQYGVQMSPGSNQLTSFAENWPQSLNTNPNAPNVFNLKSTNGATLPNNLTIPTGVITISLQHQPDGTITVLQVTVDQHELGVPETYLNIDLLGQPLAAGGTIGQGDLAQMVAFQVVLVGWANGVGATLTSGAGTITCTSSTPVTPSISWPPDSDGSNGTAEEANSTYGLVPAESSVSISQSFGVLAK